MALKWIRKRNRKLEWSMVAVLLIGWLLPLTLIAYILLYFVTSAINSQIEKTIEMSTEKAVDICKIHLDEVIRASKNASYISVVDNSYRQFLIDGKEQTLYREVTSFLKQYYRYNEILDSTILFFLGNPGRIYQTVNIYRDNDITINSLDSVEYYRQNHHWDVIDRSYELGTEAELIFLDERLYLIRNIVDIYYQPYAMLVICLEPEKIFGSLGSVWGAVNYEVFVDGTGVFGSGIDGSSLNIKANIKSTYFRDRKVAYSYKTISYSGHTITFLVDLDTRLIIREITFVQFLFALIAIFILPLFYLIFRFFRTKVTKPILSLIDASKKIKAGDYGYQILGRTNSEEFACLIDDYNAMSNELKHQFQRIYLEELAVRDASIEALQSQINPHFLNNTLEIINWESRLNGNERVSMMIEALSTMLRFTMNRDNQNYHTLSDELMYIDAYLYIIGQRFGSRFHVEMEVDESLTEAIIPRLIVQPLLENAVSHGMKDRTKAHVIVRAERKDDYLVIQIINDRKLKANEAENIANLLSEKPDPKKLSGSLGISNVNKRLKIIYGENSGLEITCDEQDRTVSTILIPLEAEDDA